MRTRYPLTRQKYTQCQQKKALVESRFYGKLYTTSRRMMAGHTRIYDPFYGDIEFEAEEGGF